MADPKLAKLRTGRTRACNVSCAGPVCLWLALWAALAFLAVRCGQLELGRLRRAKQFARFALMYCRSCYC